MKVAVTSTENRPKNRDRLFPRQIEQLLSRWWMTGDTSTTISAAQSWSSAGPTNTRGGRGVASNGKAAAESASLCTLLSLVPRLSFTGGEDQSYFFNSWVAGSSPAGPKDNRSSMAEQRKHTLVAGSPVVVSPP